MNPLRRHTLLAATALLLIALATGWYMLHRQTGQTRPGTPNFLLVITDDQSWAHTSFAGDPAVQTPNFDRIAREGVYFDNAYASAPTCTASRSAILAGQHFWRLGSAAQLWGEFPDTLVNYQKILADHGYATGYTGKGWGPGKPGKNPAGQAHNKIVRDVDPALSKVNHLENFREFLDNKPAGQPFSFWISPTEPHRPYKNGIGISSGQIDPAKIRVPAFLPDTDVVRSDIADYLFEIEWFDHELGEILDLLKARGELDNTVIVFTSDNGMPFPRAKSNNYEYGTHVPLAVRWPPRIASNRQVTDFVSLTDLAPTFLELAGIPTPQEMTGHSLTPQLFATGSGRIDPLRSAVFSGFERHIYNARYNHRGYPSRALHSDEGLYIFNFAPERWPAGMPDRFADIDDGSPSKKELMNHKDLFPELFRLATDKRPPQELYLKRNDPDELHNVADNPEYEALRQQSFNQLFDELQRSNDPQVLGHGSDFDTYDYYGKQQAMSEK